LARLAHSKGTGVAEDDSVPKQRFCDILPSVTNFELFILGLVGLWLLSHATVRWGLAAGIPASVVSLAESAVTA
jgi:hypothetical protein